MTRPMISRAAPIVVLLAVLARPASLGATDARTLAAVERAVAEAVASRMVDVEVRVVSLEAVRVPDSAEALVAVPDPAARAGRPARFTLSSRTGRGGRVRVGEATAVVAVTASVVRTTRPVDRGAVLSADDLQATREDVPNTPFRPLPTLAMAIGARTTRALTSGVPVDGNDVVAEMMVKNGAIVRATLRSGLVEIETDVLAMDPGARGDIIRVANTGSRRVLHARVTGAGHVEVIEP